MAKAGENAVVRPHYRAVLISPHLDDAVFSCGGSIAQWVAEGPVLVLNLFTAYRSDLKMHGAVLGAQRYQEEADAASFLGFESRNLGEWDAPFRCDAYRQIGNLFRPPVAEDLAWLPSLRTRVIDLLATLSFDHVCVPLGIGWHVDHVLAHQIFDTWPQTHHLPAQLLYYEDAPYCQIPHATRYRLDELGRYTAAPNDLTLMPSPPLRAWWQAARAYANTALMKNLQPWTLRKLAVPAVSYYLWRLMAHHRREASTASKRDLQPVMVNMAEQFDRKLQAMALYPSQFGEFFTSSKDATETMRHYANALDGTTEAVERYWSASNMPKQT